MNKPTKEEFDRLMVPVQSYLNDYKRTKEYLQGAFPRSNVSNELGKELLVSYVTLLETLMEDEEKYISCFVFEDDVGRKLQNEISNMNELWDLIKD